MKFPVPNTLPGAFSPMLMISWCLGIGVIEHPIGKPWRKISAFLTIVNFLFYSGFLWMSKLTELASFEESKTAARGYSINAYVCATFVASSLCIAQFNAKVVNGIFPKLTGINDRLNILGISKEYKSVFKFQIIQLCIAFLFLSIVMGMDFKYVGFEFVDESARISFLIAAHYLLVFAFIIDCRYSNIIRYLGNRFKSLNELLVESNLIKEDEPEITRSMKNQFLHYPSVINELYRHDSMVIRAADQRWLFYVIRETRKIHRNLCKVTTELNRACGLQMLVSLALSFDLLIILLHIAYNLAMASFNHRHIRDHWIHVSNNILWNSFYAIKALLIIDACETTSNEANRTGKLISKLRDNPNADEDIRDEINIFSLQLIQNPLKFTASGFFTLNYSLIRGMIGAVTTYLIIIIQVHNVYEPEKVNFMEKSTTVVQTTSPD